MEGVIFIRRNRFLRLAILLGFFLTYNTSPSVSSITPNQTTPLPSATVWHSSNLPDMVISTTVQDHVLSTKMIVVAVSATRNKTFHPQSTTKLNTNQSLTSIIPTSSTSIIYSTTTKSISNTSTPTLGPSSKTPHPPSKHQPILHKVGLIIGVVCGLIILCLCLIIFHKKEARLRCLKLLCKPCAKKYSSYNIVPIYVYDDVEQDIRELQDDSDLPLV